MNWVVIVLIILAIIGSMMWMMPSPRQQMQAILRQHAMRQGFQVQITRLLLPRALGEAFGEERNAVAYRLPRLSGKRDKRDGGKEPTPWQIFKLESHANDDLPSGWSWAKGEGLLPAQTLSLINALVEQLPEWVYGIESTPVSVSVYWEENGNQETVDLIKQQLQQLLDKGY